jgi:hypothetical protein
MSVTVRSSGPKADFQVEQLGPGLRRRRLYPGGAAGPNGKTHNSIPGQTWSEVVLLGSEEDDFIMCVPDNRLPPNQFIPMHWHDCWTVVMILEGKCLVGDWCMGPGDVFIVAPFIEYGPLVVGTMGCRLLEIFDDLARSPGGYPLEYRDHPAQQSGNYLFKPRKEGHASPSLKSVEGMWKSRLSPGWSWDLGDADDPDRGIIKYTQLAAGERITARERGDWYAALVLDGSADMRGKPLVRDDMLIAERNRTIPDMIVGGSGVQLLEFFRTSRSL